MIEKTWKLKSRFSTSIYTHAYQCIYTSIYIHTYQCIHTRAHTQAYNTMISFKQIKTSLRWRNYDICNTDQSTHTHTHAHTYLHGHAYMHMHTHTHTHTHTCIYTIVFSHYSSKMDILTLSTKLRSAPLWTSRVATDKWPLPAAQINADPPN